MRFILLLALTGLGVAVVAQESPFYKFGKVKETDLQKKVYAVDSNASAVVLSDIGESVIEGNSKGWFSIVFRRHKVVHILNKNGYDMADVEIQLYSDNDDEEKLDDVKAVTYNLEGGNIVETKLEKNAIFKEKKDKNWIIRKFTMPNVKEGSIIEFDYKVTSDFIQHLDPWFFQGTAPRLWSEYKLSVPQFFNYAFLSHGYHPLAINDKKNRISNFTVRENRTAGATENYNFTAGVTDYRWVMKDVPELKQENFTSTLQNHIARMEFQLAGQTDPLPIHTYLDTWNTLTGNLLKSEYFGVALDRINGWMGDDLKPVLAGATTDYDKAKRIYAYVRNNFICTDHSAVYASQPIKSVMKSKKGSVSEINLLLVAMLKWAGLAASPVILSTSDHGYVYTMYPSITRFNYVVAQLLVNDKSYYLDASEARLGFGKLLPECYNGHARVVNEQATALNFSADSLVERKVTALFIANNDKGEWRGSMNQNLGDYESYKLRARLKEKGEDELVKDITKGFGIDNKIEALHIDSLDDYEDPIALHYDVKLNAGSENLLYINPLFGEGYKKNPFNAAERYYPVEMPYTMDEMFLLTMQVPEGYEVDELPKQIVAKYDEEGKSFFEYRLSQSGAVISLRSRIKIAKTFFAPDEYEILKEFFNMIVSKQSEQIVFKKKKA